MATTTLTPTERAERLENRESRRKAEAKALNMRLLEGGTVLAVATGTGALKAWKPDLATIGETGIPLLELLETGGGLAMMLLTKGGLREVGSGLLYAGGVPLLQMTGAKIVQSMTP